MKVEQAPDIQKRMWHIIDKLEMRNMDKSRIVCMRSFGAKSRAYARIWSLPSIWRKALNMEVWYIIEILSEKFDKLNSEDQDKVLIHELMHIPQKFSGGLVPHTCFGKKIDRHSVDELHKRYKNAVLIG